MNCYNLKGSKNFFITLILVSLSTTLFGAMQEPKAPATPNYEIKHSQKAQVIPLHKHVQNALSADFVSVNIHTVSKERSSRTPVRKAWSSKKPSKVSLDPKESPKAATQCIQTITETATEHRAHYVAHQPVTTQPEQPLTMQMVALAPESKSAIDIKTEASHHPPTQLHAEQQTIVTAQVDDTQYCTTAQPTQKIIDEKNVVHLHAFNDPEIKQWYINAGEGKGPLQAFANAVKEYFSKKVFRSIGDNNYIVAIELEEGALTCYNALIACDGKEPISPNDTIRFIQHLQVNKAVLDLYHFFRERGCLTAFFSQTLTETKDFNPAPIAQKALINAGYVSKHAPQLFINKPSKDGRYMRTGWQHLKIETCDLLPTFIVISSNNSFFQKSSVDYAIWLPSAYRQNPDEITDYNYLQKISRESCCGSCCNTCCNLCCDLLLTCVML